MKNPIKKKTVKWTAYIILNKFGEPWSKKVFETTSEAEQYMSVFWGRIENPPDMSMHVVLPITITYTPK